LGIDLEMLDLKTGHQYFPEIEYYRVLSL